MYPGFGFNLMSVMFPVMFLLVFAIVALTILRELLQWNKNNHTPRLIVDAQVVSKRTNVSRRRRTDNVSSRTSTSYYVTFQFETGDRMELKLQGQEYGLLVEGDKGRLTFQGTRYLGFERM